MMYHLVMIYSSDGGDSRKMAAFKEKITADLDDVGENGRPGRILAACQDTESDLYLLIMAVPKSALTDPDSPDLWRTPDKNKFLVCLNEEILLEKVEYINENLNDESEDEKNRIMGEFISGFLPAMFEKAAAMEPLDI